MINGPLLKAMNITPGEAVAIASFAQLYGRNPQSIKEVLEKHNQKFTGNPNIDFFQVYKLSEDRGRFFNEDYTKALNNAKYFSLGNVVDKIKGTVGKATTSIKDAAPQLQQIAGGTLNLFGPALGGLAEAYLPGSSGVVSGLAQGLGSGLQQLGLSNQTKKAVDKLGQTAVSALPPAADAALQAALSASNPPNQNLDNNPDAGALLKFLQDMNPNQQAQTTDKPAKTMKIFGKEIKVWVVWTVGGVIVAAIIVTVILIVRSRRKKAKELAAKK